MSFLYFFVLVGHVVQILSTCPTGSVTGLDSNTCYILNSNPLYFIQADEACVKAGGHLASIHNAFTNDFLRGLTEGTFSGKNIPDYWLGGNTLFSPGSWTWTDGSPLNYNNGLGTAANDQCLSQQISNGKWNNISCFEAKAYACQINLASSGSITTPTAAPKQCPSGWIYFQKTSKCYMTVSGTGYNASNMKCKSLGGNLASIHSVEENNFIAQQFNGINNGGNEYFTFIGLYNSDGKGNYQWTDGTPLNYTNYDDPPNPSKCCIVIKSSPSNQDPNRPIGKWYWSDDTEFNGICEISP